MGEHKRMGCFVSFDDEKIRLRGDSDACSIVFNALVREKESREINFEIRDLSKNGAVKGST